MFSSLFDGSQINILIAFIGGFITFFASCLLPLVPTYLAYLSGVSLNDPEAGKRRGHIFRTGLFFVVGFVTTFVFLGLSLNRLASVAIVYRDYIEKLAGVLFVLLGLFTLGVYKSNFLSREFKFDIDRILGGSGSQGNFLQRYFQHHNASHAFLAGIAFGFGWTPCIGPVLAVILFWASQAESALTGSLLLVFYGLGLGLPFLLVALGFEKLIPLLKKYKKVSHYAMIFSGLILVLAGVLLILGQFERLSLLFLNYLNLNTLAV